MSWNYTEETVRLTFHLENPRSYSPSLEQLTRWDEDLAAKYEPKIDQVMQDAGVEQSAENRSLIVLLAQMSNGTSAVLQLRNACKYFVNVWGT